MVTACNCAMTVSNSDSIPSLSWYGSCMVIILQRFNRLGSQTCMVTFHLGSIDRRLEDFPACSQQSGSRNANDMEDVLPYNGVGQWIYVNK